MARREYSTFVAVVRSQRGTLHKLGAEVGSDAAEAAVGLADGAVPPGFTLERVERQDFADGTLTDATALVLHGVVAACDPSGVVPAALHAAFAAYGVSLPEQTLHSAPATPDAPGFPRPTAPNT